jgi:nucleoid-associated protein YgaU
MGFFDFIGDAGKALFGRGKPDSEAQHAEALKAEMDSHKLGTEDLKIEVVGDKAVIKGEVADQSVFEKAVLAVGNTFGITGVQADEVKIGGGKASEPRFHTVAKGDTLWAVATKEYGDGSKYMVIYEANTPMLSHPDKIYPGQVLRIPEL